MLTEVHVNDIVPLKKEVIINMETHENIKRLREALGLSQEALAAKVGYRDRSSIAKIEAGRVDLPTSKIAAFAAALGVSPAQLMGLSDDSPALPSNVQSMPGTYTVPLLGSIACGAPILAEENIEYDVEVPDHVRADFALRCKGDSMINARIFDGDIVYIRQQPSVDSGQIAAVLVDGDEATLKRVRLYPDHISLEPENPLYRPLVYWEEDMNTVRILGRAVAFTSAVR